MKKILTTRMFVRLLSFMCAAVLIILDIETGGFCPRSLCLSLYAAAVIAALHPFATDSTLACLVSALVYTVLVFALRLLGVHWPLLLPLSACTLLVHGIRRTVVRLKGLRQYSGTLGVWHCMEDYAWLFYIMVLACCGVLLACGELWWPKAFMCLAMLAALQIRAWSGAQLFFSKDKEVKLKELSRGLDHALSQPLPDSRMSTMYSRILTVMEEKKPYLDESFSMTDLSRMVYVNPSYVSRAINNCSGYNFSRFTNGYRIDYAMDLIRRDPHLRMTEVTTMSGFHNVVSFNSSFRAIVGKTPSEFQREVRMEAIGFPSSLQVQEQ